MFPITELSSNNLLIYLNHIHNKREGKVEDLKLLFSENFFSEGIGFITIDGDHWEISDYGEQYYNYIFKHD